MITKKADAQSPAQQQVTEPSVHLIVFRVGQEEYGIRIEQVKEVTITPEIARMPRTPDFIKGVASIRGDIIAVMDLEERFEIQSDQAAPAERTYTLVIEAGAQNMGLLVKEVPQSISVPFSGIDKTPAMLQETGMNASFIEGIAKYEGRMIIILDINKILTFEEARKLEAVSG